MRAYDLEFLQTLYKGWKVMRYLCTGGSVGSFILCFGIGTIVAVFHAEGIQHFSKQTEKRVVKNTTQTSFFNSSAGIRYGPGAFLIF